MKYIVLSTFQLILLSLLVAILTGLLITVNTQYAIYSQLPVVHLDKANACVKVVNFENGHAFNCADVDVVLRRYRKLSV